MTYNILWHLYIAKFNIYFLQKKKNKTQYIFDMEAFLKVKLMPYERNRVRKISGLRIAGRRVQRANVEQIPGASVSFQQDSASNSHSFSRIVRNVSSDRDTTWRKEPLDSYRTVSRPLITRYPSHESLFDSVRSQHRLWDGRAHWDAGCKLYDFVELYDAICGNGIWLELIFNT